MAYPTSVFAFLQSTNDFERRDDKPAEGTLIDARVVVFVDIAGELLEQVSHGKTLVVSPSGDATDAVPIERISVYEQPEDGRFAAVARLAARPDAPTMRPGVGSALRDALLGNAGDLGNALTLLADIPATEPEITAAEQDSQSDIDTSETEYLRVHREPERFARSICDFVRICWT